MPNFMRKARIAFGHGLSMANLVDRAAEQYGDRVLAILDRQPPWSVFPSGQVTFRHFQQAVDRVGRALVQLGIRRGDRVLVYKTNYVDTLAIIYGIFKVGAIAVPVNPGLPWQAALSIAQQVKPSLVVTDVCHVERTGLRHEEFCPSVRWVSADVADAAPPWAISLEEVTSGHPERLDPAYLPSDSIVALLHTSGTTGFPKLVMQSNAGLLSQGRSSVLLAPVGTKDVAIGVLPWGHVLGIGASVAALISGVCVSCLTEFSAVRVLESIEREKATIFVGYPTMFTLMSEELRRQRYNLDSMRFWHIGADAMHAVHMEEFVRYGTTLRLFGRKLLGSILSPGFGMSELGGPVFMPMWTSLSRIIPRCMGRPNPLLGKVKVGDRWGRPVPTGQTGFLWIKSPGLLKGYWNRHESFVTQMSDGFFRTGDIVRRDRWGRIYFLDRESDVIHTARGPIFSLELEEVLLTCPYIMEAAVVGVPGPDGHQLPLAVCYLHEGASASPAELRRWTRNHVPPESLPDEFVVIDRQDLPLGPTLKVQKYVLRDRYRDHFAGRSVTLHNE